MIFEPSLGITAAVGALSFGLRMVGRHDGTNTPWDRRLGGISWVGIGAWLLMQWATMLAPVVTDMHADLVERAHGVAVFRVSAVKVPQREDCEFEYVRAFVVNDAGESSPAFWERLNDPAPGASRGAGRQAMGQWRVKFSDESPAVFIRFEAHHNCGPLWGRTTTETGPFPL